MQRFDLCSLLLTRNTKTFHERTRIYLHASTYLRYGLDDGRGNSIPIRNLPAASGNYYTFSEGLCLDYFTADGRTNFKARMATFATLAGLYFYYYLSPVNWAIHNAGSRAKVKLIRIAISSSLSGSRSRADVVSSALKARL